MGGNYSVAIDLGGTIIKIGLILDSEIVRFTTISSDSVKGLSHMLPKMEHAIDSLLSEEGISSTDLVSIGLAFPGMVNPVECRVISTNDKYDDACDIDLCHWADSRWGVPFVLENDARLAVIGEWLYGAAKGTGNVVMMTIGTGIGTGGGASSSSWFLRRAYGCRLSWKTLQLWKYRLCRGYGFFIFLAGYYSV